MNKAHLPYHDHKANGADEDERVKAALRLAPDERARRRIVLDALLAKQRRVDAWLEQTFDVKDAA